MAETKIMTIAAQQYYDEKIKAHIAEEDAKLLDKIETHVHSWNDLEDKPFGGERVVIIPETICPSDGKETGVWKNFNTTFDLVVGEEYSVIYNGNEKIYTCKYDDFNDVIYIGDISPDSVNQSVCYGTFQLDKTGYLVFGTNAKMGDTIAVYSGSVKTIDETYIPDTIARISDIDNIDLTPYETKTDAASKLEEAKAFASEEDAKIQGTVDTLSGKVATLVGEDANKSVRTIANEELAKQLVAEGAKESLDTLTEIAAWIQSHPDDASAMNKAISDLEALVGALPDGVAATTVIAYIQEVVAANKALIDDNTDAIGALHPIATTGSWNDLEDKPFGEVMSYDTVYLEETIIDTTEYGYVYWSDIDDKSSSYVPNCNNLRVVFDGKAYDVEKRYDTSPYFHSYGGESDTDFSIYPFFIGDSSTGGVIYAKEQGQHTIALYEGRPSAKQIDEKFIPDTIARVADFSEVANEEIDAMFNNNVAVLGDATLDNTILG